METHGGELDVGKIAWKDVGRKIRRRVRTRYNRGEVVYIKYVFGHTETKYLSNLTDIRSDPKVTLRATQKCSKC